tara:strand:- start:1340 stop:1927 length:588 start_codon:yes stop_codon:yes gene_type:complete
MKRKRTKSTKIVLKKQKTTINFFTKINPVLKKFHQKFGYSIIGQDFANECYNDCSSKFNTPNQYNKYAVKCVEYIENYFNYLDELLWNKCLEKQFELKGFVYYRGENLSSDIEHISKKYERMKYSCNLTKKLHKSNELFRYMIEYNLLMNENLMCLESGLIEQLSPRIKLEQEILDNFIEEEIENDILKIATQLV